MDERAALIGTKRFNEILKIEREQTLFTCPYCNTEIMVIPEVTMVCSVCGASICTIPNCECGGCA